MRLDREASLLPHLSVPGHALPQSGSPRQLAGRTVLAVRGLNETQRRALADAWKGEGLHFINYFGGVASEDWGIWQGPVLPELPSWVWR